MKYDPIKKSLGKVFNKNPFLRKIFYKLLDLLLLRAWHIKKELRNWSKTIIDDISILDAGSGFGQYVYFMSQLGKKWKILGVDVKDEQIKDCNVFFEKINEKDRVKFAYADLTKYKKENSYELILCVDVMEHIEQDVQVFKNYYSSLKQNGLLIISTPSDIGHEEHEHEHESFVDEHVRDGYNYNDIKEKLQKAGFSDIEIKYTYGKPGQLAWQLSMKIPIILLNITQIFFIILPLYYMIVYPWAFFLNYLDLKGIHKTGTGLLVKAWKKNGNNTII